ncbi:nuclear transport factor 2 family protein [Sandaracinobacteroides saxicola]|uniref:Ester cyclase n=1 Tax=Sandaracinobacteroides saxicola TaxID=2759707 RepID=A0A7G5IFA2_9SPHN|nr:ester cyclase [Sandaracinobacteroides saxicola]QMW22044.1 ester cyclase [Sandaracinobacteroides saxicola]
MMAHDAGRTKRRMLEGLRALALAPVDAIDAAAGAIFAPDAGYLGAHPVNQLQGIAAIAAHVWRPLKQSFPDIERYDDIFMSGHWQGHDWISATGYYYGSFERDLFGIPAHQGWAYLRFGEFYRIVEGRIVDGYVIFDWIDLMRQAGVNPLPPARGIEGLCPGPSTRDGVMLATMPAGQSAASLACVERMIFEGMHGFDGVDHSTMNMDRYFTRNLMWYGPGGIGTTRSFDGFMRFHEIPWNEAFPDFRGGNHVARFGDGDYVCSTGWPSIRGTHSGKELFSVPATGKPITIRVMDWWRAQDGLLIENWIFIDIPELLMQLGYDLFARMRELGDRRRGRA